MEGARDDALSQQDWLSDMGCQVGGACVGLCPLYGAMAACVSALRITHYSRSATWPHLFIEFRGIWKNLPTLARSTAFVALGRPPSPIINILQAAGVGCN